MKHSQDRRGQLVRLVYIVGRAVVALLFVIAGSEKILGPKPFLAHMAEHRVPGELLPLVIALELSAGLAMLTGILWRPAAAALGVFCIATAFVFHFNPADHAETTMLAKDLALAGALLALAMSQAPSRYLQDPQ